MRFTSLIGIGAFCAMLAAAPAVATASRPAAEPAVSSCREVPDYVGPQDIWYMRAAYSLDCIRGLIDAHLAAMPHTEDDVVEVPRTELERIRALVSTAHDAAARIGR